MEEQERARRRMRRRRRHWIRRLQQWLPVALVLLAAALSAGVIRVMEEGSKQPDEPRPPQAAVAPGPKGPSRHLSPTLHERRLDAALSISILQGEPEEPGEVEPETGLPQPPPDLGLDLEDLDLDLSDARTVPRSRQADQLAPVPEPGSLVCVAGGLAWLGRRRSRYSTISRSSTSNVMAAAGGISGGCPRSL